MNFFFLKERKHDQITAEFDRTVTRKCSKACSVIERGNILNKKKTTKETFEMN